MWGILGVLCFVLLSSRFRPSYRKPQRHFDLPGAVAKRIIKGDLKVGSREDGSTIARSPCVSGGCGKPGIYTCSQCKLVKYCSKTCQQNDWQTHKKSCQDPYNSESWNPQWVVKGREPAFIGGEGGPALPFSREVAHFLWGNTPAIDCLRLSNNEGMSESVQKKFRICFAGESWILDAWRINIDKMRASASGSIRNIVKTVNGLPERYAGRLTIVLNDRDPIVTFRNALFLIVLANAGRDPDSQESAAEFVLHLLYSVALTEDQNACLTRYIFGLFADESWDRPGDTHLSVADGRIHLNFTAAHAKPFLDMVFSGYDWKTAKRGMSKVMLAPERVDYRDRYYASLKPGHRTSAARYRESGILLPFGIPKEHFNQPNRTMFSKDGEWLTTDSANPMFAWDPREFFASGADYGCQSEDVVGCLFFRLKHEFLEFARRINTFDMEIHVEVRDASELSRKIKGGGLGDITSFDRVVTSNVSDYVGIDTVIKDWGPLLNKNSKHAALLAYSLNWHAFIPNSSPDNSARKSPVLDSAMQRAFEFLKPSPRDFAPINGTLNPRMGTFMMKLSAFHDNSASFREYLDKFRTHEVAALHGLRLRDVNQVSSKINIYHHSSEDRVV
ncbi:hypothetical protein EW146_g601 [Bondarzewia mesenterica]|uniref:MYND-type domain-containing protein n=1 Tax=Bondarzewia mesenterica TaxID=1095465 RepID=A0A4S4M6S0_9AGAM|nr:hypothetical protein EW146_g601 [Bondarzewia mesenterica]